MKAYPAIKYILAKHTDELEQLNLEYYKTEMLLYIAQPTRKNPNALKPYSRVSDKVTKMKKPDKSGDEILQELLAT